MPNEPNKPQTQSIEERAKLRLIELTSTREQIRQQLIAVENQIYAINDLLNPKTVASDSPQNTSIPADTPPGTI